MVMTVLLLLLMGYMVTGQEIHEWMGTGMFVLFLGHHVLNRKWFRALFKGKYNPYRILMTTINLLLLIAMVGLMISGIIMSRFVFDFVSFYQGISLARIVHLLCSYWGFVLMSVHLGLHWGMVVKMLEKKTTTRTSVTALKICLRVLAAGIALYGLYAFAKNNLLSYMLLQNTFVFFDFEQSVYEFILEYFSMMEMWACAVYYLSKILKKQPLKHMVLKEKGENKA